MGIPRRIVLARILNIESTILVFVCGWCELKGVMWPLAALSLFTGGKIRQWILEDKVAELEYSLKEKKG